jgi:hypothetical protein
VSIRCSLRLEVIIIRLAAEVLQSKCICTHSGSNHIHSAPVIFCPGDLDNAILGSMGVWVSGFPGSSTFLAIVGPVLLPMDYYGVDFRFSLPLESSHTSRQSTSYI